jgi:DNA-binding GntR family transcriptional regulator
MNMTRAATFLTMASLDRDSGVPLWRQLCDRMRDEISSGRVTGKVPSTRALATRYGVSRDVAQQALDQLRAEGLTVAYPGKGTFVRRDEP